MNTKIKCVVSVLLAIVLICGLVGCGVDYEKKGYDDTKAVLDARSAEMWPDGAVDDDTRLGFQFLIMLGGFDNVVDSLMTDFVEQLPIEDSWTEEQKELYLSGARTAVSEWIQYVSGNSLSD